MTPKPGTISPRDSWRAGLHHVLAVSRGEFAILELRNAGALGEVRQTGFTWTRQEGVICLAMNRVYFGEAVENPFVRAIIAPATAIGRDLASDKAVIVSDRAEELYLHLHSTQLPAVGNGAQEVHDSASVDATAVLRGHVQIEAGAVIGPRVVIDGPAVVRRNARIDAGAIVGCDGLYAKTILGERVHIPHFGGVEIGEQAYIHAGAIVARSAIKGEATRIAKGAHVGIMSNVGHDVEIGEGATLSSNCVIAGRSRIGAHVWIGASATISNAVRVGDHARVRLGAVVIRGVPARGDVAGNFAVEHTRALRGYLKGTDR
jgi:UDP-3-O-[3-hydroxymyristoyl] glucosamine N-acyltransferase